jgi:hypothetical protein
MADPRIIPLREPNQGVQFSPFGFTNLDESRAQGTSTEALGGAMPAAEPEREEQPRQRGTVVVDRPTPVAKVRAAEKVAIQTGLSGTPNQVLRGARARIKELRAFLKQADKARKELQELERLVAAAKKPLAPVRDIKRSAG